MVATVDDGQIVATVHGTQRYRVELTRSDGAFPWSCSWPSASAREMSKHVVAAGSTATDRSPSGRGSGRRRAPR